MKHGICKAVNDNLAILPKLCNENVVFLYCFFFIKLLFLKFNRHKNYIYEVFKEFWSITHKIASFWASPRLCHKFISIAVIFYHIQGLYYTGCFKNKYLSLSACKRAAYCVQYFTESNIWLFLGILVEFGYKLQSLSVFLNKL